MPIEDRLRERGSWSVTLRADASQATLEPILKGTSDARGFFGHIVITPTHLNTGIGDAAMLDAAHYVGPLIRIASAEGQPFELSGYGLAFWLERVLESAITLTTVSGTFTAWVTAIVAAIPALSLGTIYGPPAGTMPGEFIYRTGREALDLVCDFFDADWRINTDGSLDAGPRTAMWPSNTTPTAIVTRKASGREPEIDALQTIALPIEEDVEDYRTRYLVIDTSDPPVAEGAATISPATPYRDLLGNAVVLTEMENLPDLDDVSTTIDDYAAQQLAKVDEIRRHVELATDTYDISGQVQAGDAVWVWDQRRYLRDTANQVALRGEHLNPIKLRVHAVRWPIVRGMGVYFRSALAVYTDLTSHVVWESGGQVETAATSNGAAYAGPHV